MKQSIRKNINEELSIGTIFFSKLTEAGLPVIKTFENEKVTKFFFNKPGSFQIETNGDIIIFQINEVENKVNVNLKKEYNSNENIEITIESEEVVYAVVLRNNSEVIFKKKNLSLKRIPIFIEEEKIKNGKNTLLIELLTEKGKRTKKASFIFRQSFDKKIHGTFSVIDSRFGFPYKIKFEGTQLREEDELIVTVNGKSKSNNSNSFFINEKSSVAKCDLVRRGKVLISQNLVLPVKKLKYKLFKKNIILDVNVDYIEKITINGKKIDKTNSININYKRQNVIEIEDVLSEKKKITI